MARRIVRAQLVAGGCVGLVFGALHSFSAGIAAVMGSAAVVLGSIVLARLLLRGGVQSAEAVMLRLVLGMAVKWVVIAAVLLLAIAVWRLSPLPLMAGLVAAFIASAAAALQKN